MVGGHSLLGRKIAEHRRLLIVGATHKTILSEIVLEGQAKLSFSAACYVVEDMGYDCDRHRDRLRANNNVPVIPGRKNRKVKILYDKTVYKLRQRIERLFGKIKENRRLTVRYEKSDAAFLAFIALAILLWHLC